MSHNSTPEAEQQRYYSTCCHVCRHWKCLVLSVKVIVSCIPENNRPWIRPLRVNLCPAKPNRMWCLLGGTESSVIAARDACSRDFSNHCWIMAGWTAAHTVATISSAIKKSMPVGHIFFVLAALFSQSRRLCTTLGMQKPSSHVSRDTLLCHVKRAMNKRNMVAMTAHAIASGTWLFLKTKMVVPVKEQYGSIFCAI